MHEITLSGPGKNALGSDMMRWLLGQLAEADGQAVLLSGTADAFSAGLNLKELASLDSDEMLAFLDLLEESMAAYYNYPAPIVGHINGHAIAGGCILALCCDIRLSTANPRARIGLNEAAIGLRFPPGIMHIVRNRVPRGHAHEVVLGAGLYSPEDALRVGLIDEVCDDAEARAEYWFDILSGHSLETYRLIKSDLRPSIAPSAAERAEFLEYSLPLWTSPNLKKRLLQILGK